MRTFILQAILLMAFTTLTVSAQQTFLIKDASKKFDVKIHIDKCDEGCQGPATVYLFKKESSSVFQKIAMPNLYIGTRDRKQTTANIVELSGENYNGVIFNDFNFDGAEDLALRNGSNGVYGADSYDVFLFGTSKNRFSKNAALTELANEYYGMFEVDKKQKTIQTSSKSGCCWYQITQFKLVNNRPIRVYVFTRDVDNDGADVETTETLINGKWRKSIKKTSN